MVTDQITEIAHSDIARERARAEAAEARVAVLGTERYVPGEWECPNCGFTLQKNFLHAETGAVSVNDADVREVCPNDGATLRRQTWESRAQMAASIVLEDMKRAEQAETALAALRAAAQQALDHVNELRDAWERGAISEHDGRGGTRSNRNVDVAVALRRALAVGTTARG